MEKKYLALVRESDFLDLYKYGEMDFNRDMIIEMKAPIDEIYKDKSIFDKLFAWANPFDYAFSYVMLYYIKINNEEPYQWVTIDDVRSVIPLNRDSKVRFEDSYDDRIEFKQPLPDSWCLDVQKKWDFKSCKQGVRYLWDMLNIRESIEDYEAIISDKTVRDMIDMMYDDCKVREDVSIWAFALRYTRHASYPKDKMIGYFMDCVHIVCNYINKENNLPDKIKKTVIYQFLDQNRYAEKYYEIVDMMRSSEQCSPFLNKTMGFANGEPFFEAVPLFLFYRNIFAEQFKIDRNILGMLTYGKKLGKTFNIAIYLLGIYLGRETLIDCYYEWKRLPIFNKFKYRKYLDFLGINGVDEKEISADVKKSVDVGGNGDSTIHEISNQDKNVSVVGECVSHLPNEIVEIIKDAFHSEFPINSNKKISYYCEKIGEIWKGKYDETFKFDLKNIPEKTNTKRSWEKCREKIIEYIDLQSEPKLDFGN